MASITGAAAAALIFAPRQRLAVKGVPGLKSVSFSNQRRSFPSVRVQRSQISCAAKPETVEKVCEINHLLFQAKPETVEKVCEIVKKQLAVAEGTAVSGATKFSDLGADSLDTVEIVMGLEEAFNISVEEDSAQAIATVQDAADMIEELLEALVD